MADRVSALIRLGGALPRALFEDFLAIVDAEGLSTEWGGAINDGAHIPADAPLGLMADEVAGGSFTMLEDFCVQHRLAFSRSCNGYPGQWSGERLVFDGAGEVRSFQITDDDHVVIARAEMRALGSMAAIEAHFASADIAIPPLTLAGDEVDHG